MTVPSLSVRLHARLGGLPRSGRILWLTAFSTATAEGRSNERLRRASLSAVTLAAFGDSTGSDPFTGCLEFTA